MLCVKTILSLLTRDEKNYKEAQLEDLIDFVGWLRSPYKRTKVTPLRDVKAQKTAKTVYLTVTVVTNYYDYLYCNEQLSHDMSDILMRQVFTGGKS